MAKASILNPDGKKMLLSIDGGGMRGTIPIAMLAELESVTGEPCNDWFDLVAGTSTGAIIAVGLAIGMSAQQILEEVYLDRLRRAFEETSVDDLLFGIAQIIRALGIRNDNDLEFVARLITNNWRFAFSLTRFLELLEPLVGNQVVGDLTHPDMPILFATTKDVQAGETIFVVSAGAGLGMVRDWPLSGVVAASGAAPIFFPPVLNRFVDGGVGVYGNPCLAASIEAMEYIPEFRDSQEQVIHISLGTGYVENKLTANQAKEYNFFDWMKYLIVEGMDDAALQQVYTTRAIYPTERMELRRFNPFLRNIELAALVAPTADQPDASHLGLASFAVREVALMEQIGRSYARTLLDGGHWTQAEVMPWDTPGGHYDPRDRNQNPAQPVVWDRPFVE